jgi:hypothetical protein
VQIYWARQRVWRSLAIAFTGTLALRDVRAVTLDVAPQLAVVMAFNETWNVFFHGWQSVALDWTHNVTPAWPLSSTSSIARSKQSVTMWHFGRGATTHKLSPSWDAAIMLHDISDDQIAQFVALIRNSNVRDDQYAKAADAIIMAGDSVRPMLIALLTDPEKLVRDRATELLGRIVLRN